MRRRTRFTSADLRLGCVVFVAVFAVGAFLPEQIAVPRRAATPASAASTVDALVPSLRLRVIDGDTVEIRDGGERVRLANIDTPESGDRARCAAERAAASAATDSLRALVRRAGHVAVERTGRTDRYGRTIGFLRLDGEDAGRLMIAAGHARPWWGRREPWCDAAGALIH